MFRTHMKRFACRDYGFECDFEVMGEDDAVKKFGEHSTLEHGIEYSKDVLAKIVERKR